MTDFIQKLKGKSFFLPGTILKDILKKVNGLRNIFVQNGHYGIFDANIIIELLPCDYDCLKNYNFSSSVGQKIFTLKIELLGD
jgi:hypothetical protein